MRPNILLFHCHDLGRHLGCYGQSSVRSPNIDRLASEGVQFSNSFCVAPQCSPSRAAMFTGRYPHNNGVMGLTHGSFAWDLHENERHLAGILREAGYETVSVGVMHETQKPADYLGFDKRYDLRENTASAPIVCDHAVSVLEDFANQSATELGRQKPFFLSVGCYEPHRIAGSNEGNHMGFVGDYISPDEARGVSIPGWLSEDQGTRDELAELQGSIHYVDTSFGRILDALDRHSLTDSTLVIFTTDHGIAMPRAKCTCYDPGLEIALILRLPTRDGWHGGREVSELIPNIDLSSTLCELAGAAIPSTVQGRSFAPLLDGHSYIANPAIYPELTYHDYYDPIRGIRTDRYKLLAFFTTAPSFMPPNQSWIPRSSPRIPEKPATSYHPHFELYDLLKDPHECTNLFNDPSYATIRSQLLGDLCRHLESTEDPILNGAVTPPAHARVVDELKRKSLK